MTDPARNDEEVSPACVESASSLSDMVTRLGGTPRESWVDKLHRDQAGRWAGGQPVSIEAYLRYCSNLGLGEEDALVLICGEVQLRRQAGETVTLAEYVRRFPQYALQLSMQFQIHSLLATSVANGSGAIPCPSCHNSIELPENEHSDQLICPTCGTNFELDGQSTSQWSPGEIQRRLGRYELIDLVGAGSFGMVFKARDPELDRVVAIKIPRAGRVASRGDVERFLREARSVAKLRHPSIVSIYEVGQAAGLPYLVSEFVQGITLADLMSARRPPPREAAELIAAAADALQYAHEMGVVHRDIKPANIMLDERGTPKLMDFGLAKRETGDVTMTIEGQILGTPAYMSPEQAKGEAHGVDGRTDVYSLGVILYQLLTGELPFRGTTRMLLHQVLHDEPRRPRSLADHVPRDLETICLRAMDKEPGGRYATARDMADDLRRFLKGEPIHARPIGRAERLWRWSRRNPMLAALAATIVTLLIVVAVGSTIAAAQFRTRAQTEKWLRNDTELARQELESNLYFQNITSAHLELTGRIPSPREAEGLLESCPPKLRGWEWSYLRRLWHDEPVVLRDTGNTEINSVAFSPDGVHIAAACRDNTVKVWDIRTRQVVTLTGHEKNVVSVAFDPNDGNRLASASADMTVRVWDLRMRKEVLTCQGRESPVKGAGNSVAFSQDGRWLAAASEGGAVRIWDATTGQFIRDLPSDARRASFVAFSPDGRLMATGSWRGTVWLWDAHTGECLFTLRGGRTLPAGSIAFSPDGRRLAVGYFDRLIDIWDTSTGQRLRTLSGHTGIVLGLAFSKDGKRLASASEDRTVRMWEATTGREILQLRGHTNLCASVAFSPDGRRLASAGRDGTIRFWDATPVSGDLGQELLTLRGHTHEIWAVAISPDGTRIASAGIDPTIRVWDARTGQVIKTLSETTAVFDLAFSPDGRYLAAAGTDEADAAPLVVKIWDAQTWQPVFRPLRRPRAIFAVAFSPTDNRWMAIGLEDGSVELVDFQTGRVLRVIGKHGWEIHMRGLVFRPDGGHLASLDNGGTLSVWDVQAKEQNSTPPPLFTLRNSRAPLFSVSYSPDGHTLVTGTNDGELSLWEAETGKHIRAARGTFGGELWGLAFSPNGQWIASAGASCTAQIWKWDATTLEPILTLRGHLGPIRCLAVSKDGKLLATGGGDKNVKLWDFANIDVKSP